MSDVREILSSIMAVQRFAVLATQGEGAPYTNLVAYSYSDNLTTLLFVTPRDTSKFRNICVNPGVSLFIDNRSNRGSDIESAVGISVSGIASLLDNGMKEDLLRSHIERHPYLADFAQDAGIALISVAVTRYTVVRNLTQVEVFDPAKISLSD